MSKTRNNLKVLFNGVLARAVRASAQGHWWKSDALFSWGWDIIRAMNEEIRRAA